MARAFIGLLLFAASVSAGPLGLFGGSDSCALQCPKTNKIAFEQGKVYKYDYESNIKTHIAGASEEHSGLHLEATVNIYVLSKCDFILKLTNVVLKDSNKDADQARVAEWREFSRKLEVHALRFAYQDGRIADLCPASGEDSWSLNIKRGILSSLQNNMPDLERDHKLKETDVAGNCDSEYTFISKGSEVKVKKTKDILGCTDRHQYEGQVQGVPYNVPSKVQSLPIMKTSHECEQVFDSSGRFMRSNCEEKHTFRPFSKHQAGAVTEIQHKLLYISHSTGSIQRPAIRRRTSLLYEHTLTAEESSEKREEVGSLMRSICSNSESEIKPETPELFMKLVKALKTLDSATLQAVYADISGPRKPCSNAEKFYRDAIPVLNTPAAMTIIRKLITDKVVKDSEAEMWATSVAFISKPTRQMLEELEPLLEMEPLLHKGALGISSMVHNYCLKTASCERDTIVNSIVRKLGAHLNRDCSYNTDEKYQNIIMALKSIGNIGFASSVVPVLNRCVMNKGIDMHIRVMAVQAFRRMGCDADRSDLMSVFSAPEFDSELRISAYLALMQCPTKATIDRAARVLAKEEVNQVGSFVWTHLMNLKETSDPLKQKVRAIVQNVELGKKFDIDKRKYSRNVEWSAFSEMINTGVQVDSNLLWSTKSFIPRSASANLTIDVFGTALNLLDVGGRVEGLEKLMDHFLVPPEKKGKAKHKEEPPSDIKAVDNKFKASKADSPSASYYLRIFGNEIRYEDLQNLEPANVKERMNYLQWLIDLAKEHDYDVTKSMMLMDSTMVIPTVTGLPLKLNIEGAATVNVKVNGKLDLRKIFAAPRSVDVHGRVKPSAAVEIVGNMGVDAGAAFSGLRMKSVLHTSTVVDGKVLLQDGKIFNFEWNLPEDKMEILSVDTKFYVVYKDSDKEQKMITEGRYVKSKCYPDKITGLEVCGEIQLPPFYTPNGPLFPLTGPTQLRVVLNKKDTLRGFHFETKFLQEKVRKDNEVQITDIARVSFNTPGSKVDRELTFDLSLNRATRDLRLNMRSPWKKLYFSGSLTNTPELRRLKANLLVDNSKEYGFLSELAYVKKGSTVEVTPKVQLVIPGQPPRSVSGQIVYEPKKSYRGELTISNVWKRPVTMTGQISNVRGNRFSVNMNMRSPILIVDVKGFSNAGSFRATVLDISYKMRGSSKQSIGLRNKIRYRLSKNSLIQGSNLLTFSSYPKLNTDVDFELKKGAKVALAKMNFGYGQNYRKNVMSLSVINKDLSNARATQNQFNGKFIYPEMNIEYSAKVSHKHTGSLIVTKADINYAPKKKKVPTATLR